MFWCRVRLRDFCRWLTVPVQVNRTIEAQCSDAEISAQASSYIEHMLPSSQWIGAIYYDGYRLARSCGEPFFLQLCSVTSVRCTLGMSTMLSDFSWHEPTSECSSNQTWQFAFWLKAWLCIEQMGGKASFLKWRNSWRCIRGMWWSVSGMTSALTTTLLLKNERKYVSLCVVAIYSRAYVCFST